ncbi:hypothetical protein ACWC0C_36935 [Streptomyces sp. NPDC001709]
MVFTADGRALETGDAAGRVSTWDMHLQQTRSTHTVASAGIASSVSLPQDSHVIAALTSDDGGSVLLLL